MANIEFLKVIVIGDEVLTGIPCWNFIPRDLRDIIPLIQGLYDSENKKTDSYEDPILLVSYTNNGTYYCVFRCLLNDRPNDHQAIWLYIPNDIEIDYSSFYDVIIQLKELVKGFPSGIVDDKINKIISKIKYYDEVPQVFFPANNDKWKGAKYAFRKATIQNSFSDIIKKGYQKYYEGYKAILLFDRETSLTGKSCLADLSDNELKNYILFSVKELNLSDEVTAYLDNGELFDKPMMVLPDDAVFITFKKDRFKPIRKSIHVNNVSFTLDWQLEVTKDVFIVLDYDSKDSVLSFDVEVNRKLLKSNQPVYVSETQLRKVSVLVKSPGYKEFNKTIDFSAVSSSITILLEHNPINYYFSRQFVKGFGAEKVTVNFPKNNSKILAEGEHPIPLYKIVSREENNKALELDKEIVMQLAKEELRKDCNSPYRNKRFYVFLLCALFGGLLLGYLMGNICQLSCFNNQDVVENEEATYIDTNQKKDDFSSNNSNNEVKTANDYLKTHQVWDKNEMEKIESLKGVWDALNTYDYNKIKEVNNKYHFDAPNWNSIMDAINSKKYVRQKGCSPICKDGDKQLTIIDKANSANNYLNIIYSPISSDKTKKEQSLGANNNTQNTNSKETTEQTENKNNKKFEDKF